jgi:tetratricopeptide (TPR) repeat protein
MRSEVGSEVAHAYYDRGNALREQARLDEALASYDQAIALEPRHLEALWYRGIVLRDLKRPEEALASFEKAVAVRPDLAQTFYVMAAVLRDLKRPDEALASYDRAIALKPDFADAFSNRAVLLRELKRADEALASYDRAIALKPDLAEALYNRANLLQQLKRTDEALAGYDRAVALKPDFAEAFCHRGAVLQHLQRPDEALASLDKALALKPDLAQAHFLRAGLLRALKRPDEALASYDRAVAVRPNFAEAWSNRANLLRALERRDEAMASYDQAIAANPNFVEASYNRGVMLQDLHRFDEALASYRQATAVKPDYAQAHFNHALLLLMQGRFAEGWEEYEWRWRGVDDGEEPRTFDYPPWQGEDLAERTIFLYQEQGYGDAIQFLRYVPLVAARGGRVVLEVDEPLTGLARRLPGAADVMAAGGPPPSADFHCPLMSLPRVFGTTLATIPNQVPYLQSDREGQNSSTIWRRRLAPLEGIRVGLTWAASLTAKSIPLEQLARIADVRHLSFVSLQKGPAASEAQLLPPPLVVHDWTDEFHDFSDTAALIEELDLVISVDTSVAHLAGALGKPVWLLNRYHACWRWLLDRDDSPWYPTLRQFRQPQPGDWDTVVANVRAALAKWEPGWR